MTAQTFRKSRKFRFSLRALMLAVAVVAILLAIFMFNARRFDRRHPTTSLVVAGLLTLAESVVLYYIALTMFIARGLIIPAKRAGQLKPVLIFGPGLGVIATAALLVVLDSLAVSS
jgi:hypothetical protein